MPGHTSTTSPPHSAGHWFADAGDRYRAGRIEDAITCLRRAVDLDPRHADAWNNLGGLLLSRGRPAEAIDCLDATLRLRPDDGVVLTNLGRALLHSGRLGRARTCLERAARLQPEAAAPLGALGELLRRTGEPEAAGACYRRLLKLRPDDVQAWNNLGIVLAAVPGSTEAEACFRRAVALRPDYPEALTNLAHVRKQRGAWQEAVDLYQRAIRAQPDFSEAIKALGRLWLDQDRPADAAACCRQALRVDPGDGEALCMFGEVCHKEGRHDSARDVYHRALTIDDQLAEAQRGLAAIAVDLGDYDDAVGHCRRAMELDDGDVDVHCMLAHALRRRLPETDRRRLADLLGRPALSDTERATVHFALATVHQGRGEHATAAAHLARANPLQRAHLLRLGQDYDPRDYARFVDRMMGGFDTDFLERVRGLGDQTRLPVFVVGMPRSGTTLTERILTSHPRVRGVGERPFVANDFAALAAHAPGQTGDPVAALPHVDGPALRAVAGRHLRWLDPWRADAIRIVDKTPENYVFVGLIAALFPRARIIHCRRDARDTALSCWTTCFTAVRWAFDVDHIVDRFGQYHRLMDHWRRVLPSPMLELDYEQTVSDLEATARRLIAFVGLPWDATCLEHDRNDEPIRTASKFQARQPVYRSSVGRWRHYADALGPMFDRLGG